MPTQPNQPKDDDLSYEVGRLLQDLYSAMPNLDPYADSRFQNSHRLTRTDDVFDLEEDVDDR